MLAERGVDDQGLVLCKDAGCSLPALVEHAPGSSCGYPACALHAYRTVCPWCARPWIEAPKVAA